MATSIYCDLRPKFWQPPWVADFGAKKAYYTCENSIRGSIRRTLRVLSLCSMKGGETMNNDKFINAKQIAQELDISDSYGYKIIRQLNAELRRKGYITLAGRVSRPYFYKRFYDEKKEDKG